MVWDELGLTQEEYEELEQAGIVWELDEGSSGESPNSYYADVPEGVSPEILKAKGWKVGDSLRVSLWAFDGEDDSAFAPED
ncbi:hypothetical protein [Aeromonas veronii]|uniref:hypothetical protein n=1 Tax=Aeromonas veronii TaxID=654 RepID=UPI003A17A521